MNIHGTWIVGGLKVSFPPSWSFKAKERESGSRTPIAGWFEIFCWKYWYRLFKSSNWWKLLKRSLALYRDRECLSKFTYQFTTNFKWFVHQATCLIVNKAEFHSITILLQVYHRMPQIPLSFIRNNWIVLRGSDILMTRDWLLEYCDLTLYTKFSFLWMNLEGPDSLMARFHLYQFSYSSVKKRNRFYSRR